MKKIILSLVAAGMVSTAANAQAIISPELGLNMSNLSMKSAGSSVSTSMKVGLLVGANVEFGLTDNLYLAPGLFFKTNGCKMSGSPEVTISLNTIQIPVNVIYKLGDEGDNRFFFGAGPYLGYNLSGKMKASGTSTSLNIGTDKAKDDIKPLDFGVGLNVGYMLANGLFFRAQYQLGLSNLAPAGDADNSIKHSAIGVSAGYCLGGHAKKSKGGKKK